MEIKVKGGSTYLIRSVPNGKGRSMPKRLAILKTGEWLISPQDAEALTAAELEQLRAFVATQKGLETARQQEAEKARLTDLPRILAEFQAKLQAHPEQIHEKAAIWLVALHETEAVIREVEKAHRAPGLLARVAAAVKG